MTAGDICSCPVVLRDTNSGRKSLLRLEPLLIPANTHSRSLLWAGQGHATEQGSSLGDNGFWGR
jgi:hypothetical protein